MEQKIEREWQSIACPDRKEKTVVICEWDVLSEKGNIPRGTLRQIDCHNPGLSELGGADCGWAVRGPF